MRFEYDRCEPKPLIRTDAYAILEAGRFPSRGVRLHVQGGRKSYSPARTEIIDQVWARAEQEAEEKEQRLFDGKLFSLLNHGVRQGTLNLLLGETSYKEFVGTHLSHRESDPPAAEADRADALAVCTTLITKDGLLVLGERSGKVFEGSGCLHVCAGHPDPEKLLEPEEILAGENLLFAAMKREILEEFHVPVREISDMACLGLVRNSQNLKPEVIFQTSLKVSGQKLLERRNSAKDRDEHREILLVPSGRDELIDFLERHYERFSPPGLAAVVAYGVSRGYWTEKPIAIRSA